jgi:hypothetical protein
MRRDKNGPETEEFINYTHTVIGHFSSHLEAEKAVMDIAYMLGIV